MRNCRTRDFRALFDQLPANIQNHAKKAFQLFLENPAHPSLRNHKLEETKTGQHRPGSRSVAISIHYRAIYVTEENMNVWYWIGSHADYDKFAGGS
jgi:hypothetical protein